MMKKHRLGLPPAKSSAPQFPVNVYEVAQQEQLW
jgi:hypothetical protein